MSITCVYGALKNETTLKSFLDGSELKLTGLDLVQPVLSNNVIMLADKDDSTKTYKVLEVDDIPKDALCEELGNKIFIPIIQTADKNYIYTLAAVRASDLRPYENGQRIKSEDFSVINFQAKDDVTTLSVHAKVTEEKYHAMLEAIDDEDKVFIIGSRFTRCDEETCTLTMTNANIYIC